MDYENFLELMKLAERFEHFGITLHDKEQAVEEPKLSKKEQKKKKNQQHKQQEQQILIPPPSVFKSVLQIEDWELEFYKGKFSKFIDILHPSVQCCPKTKEVWLEGIGRIRGVKFLKAFRDVVLTMCGKKKRMSKNALLEGVLKYIIHKKKSEFQLLRYYQELTEDRKCLLCKNVAEYRER